MVSTKHTLVALVEDKPGVLNRLVSLFRRRGFNIASIAVGSSETPGLSRITFVVDGPLAMVEQVRKQLLAKVVEIVKVLDITNDPIVVRELALIKVKAPVGTRSEIIQIVDIFRSDIVDVSQNSLTIQITGTEDKIDSLVDLLRPFGIKEIARTGRIAMSRGSLVADEERPAKQLSIKAKKA
jgi:acetolactate synthase-1/3 small subunit